MARPKKLKRNKKDKLVAGVIGGFSEYWEIDPTVLRIVWLIILAFTGFVPGIVVYVISILIIPSK